MILAIDCGNTRLKWGLRARGAETWQAAGALPLTELARLESDWAALVPPSRIAIANVAGDGVHRRLEELLAKFPVPISWIASVPTQCGVTNSYADPGQLGADRWAALIGAWHLVRGPCLVVNAGTATTVDMLSSRAVFLGGLILPGVELMKRALAMNTAGLPLAQGHFAQEPRNTADAIESGCMNAQAGAIERMFARLEAGAACLLSGGSAASIAAVLGIPARIVENLGLEGLARIAE